MTDKMCCNRFDTFRIHLVVCIEKCDDVGCCHAPSNIASSSCKENWFFTHDRPPGQARVTSRDGPRGARARRRSSAATRSTVGALMAQDLTAQENQVSNTALLHAQAAKTTFCGRAPAPPPPQRGLGHVRPGAGAEDVSPELNGVSGGSRPRP